MMPLLLALFFIVHGGVHIGYLCSRSWPFEPRDPWLVTALGVPPAVVATACAALVLATFIGFLVAALAGVGLLPRALWRPAMLVGSVASAVALVVLITPGTVPGLVIDCVVLWAVLARGWRPTPLIGPRARAGRPVTS
jgi:hypothetical protein